MFVFKIISTLVTLWVKNFLNPQRAVQWIFGSINLKTAGIISQFLGYIKILITFYNWMLQYFRLI